MHKKLKQQKKFFNACKKCSKNKKTVLQTKFVFTTEEMLQIMKKIKSTNATKSIQKQPQKCPIQTILENNKKNMPNNESNNSNSDYMIVADRSQYLKLKMAEKVAG